VGRRDITNSCYLPERDCVPHSATRQDYCAKTVRRACSSHEGPRLREGDKVYLIRRNIRTIRLSDKLNYKKFRLFKIIRYIKGINFEF
jgi:hypothetical protein